VEDAWVRTLSIGLLFSLVVACDPGKQAAPSVGKPSASADPKADGVKLAAVAGGVEIEGDDDDVKVGPGGVEVGGMKVSGKGIDLGDLPSRGASDGTGNNCPKGGCNVTCSTGEDCHATCSGGGCKHTCEGGTCDFTCSGGKCDQTCEAGSTCTLTCSGGGCTRSCGGAKLCNKTCSGDGCSG
jgi:hypothetical protein